MRMRRAEGGLGGGTRAGFGRAISVRPRPSHLPVPPSLLFLPPCPKQSGNGGRRIVGLLVAYVCQLLVKKK